ncbi:hypothetical protein JKF63_04726 [Porcisia hertigi]|uniref:Uncharacterized protein n=1 Tax=Porcisia hertigi TaxID=2761500 RepID=A0A836IKP9_9TRYP|nr:hypothetical protein JKF63_04726 [Porcisia hertigi]
MQERFDSKRLPLDVELGTTAGCEKFVKHFVDLVDEYASLLASVVCKAPQFSSLQLYHWASPLMTNQHTVLDDYWYELFGMYYNLGKFLMNIARYLLSVDATPAILSRREVDAYRIHINASAYFYFSAGVLGNLKKHEIGVLEVSVPFKAKRAITGFLAKSACAQVQEISVWKALSADPKEYVVTTSALSNQLLVMYDKPGAISHRKKCQAHIL